jgi:hypothetical protein
MSTIELLLDDARGIYIPQAFAECFDLDAWHVSPDDAAILAQGPEHDLYWDTWQDVLDNAYYMANGQSDLTAGLWTLEQDGCLFARHESHENEDVNEA